MGLKFDMSNGMRIEEPKPYEPPAPQPINLKSTGFRILGVVFIGLFIASVALNVYLILK